MSTAYLKSLFVKGDVTLIYFLTGPGYTAED